MTADLQPYPAMKDSGVEWLDEVPAHWEVRRLGRLGRLFKGGGGTKEDEREDGTPCVRYGDLYTHHQLFITESRACVTPELVATTYTPIRYGDVLFAGSGETIDEIGKSAVNLIRGPACCGGDVIIFRPSIDANARFLGYATDCSPSARQKAGIGRGFTVMHIYSSDLKYMTVAIPPLPEQTAIVRFLDHTDRRIRRYIRAKEKLIALLEESRTTLITHAVTRGLDQNAGTHSTRSHVFPLVPDGWTLWRIRRLIRRVRRPVVVRPETEYREIGIRSWGKGIFHKDPVRGAMLGEKSVFRIEPGDFVLNIVFAWEGAVSVVSENETGMIASHRFPTFRPSPDVDLDYLLMIFQSEQGRRLMELNSPGAAGRNKTLRVDQFLDEAVPLPTVDVQKAIVSAVRDEERRLADSAAKSRQAVQHLKDLRTATIAAAVTGKLDVREAAARLANADQITVEDDLDDGLDKEAGTVATGRLRGVAENRPWEDVSDAERSEARQELTTDGG